MNINTLDKLFNNYIEMSSIIMSEIEEKLIEFEYNPFLYEDNTIDFYIKNKKYSIEIYTNQLRLFNDSEDYYFNSIRNMFDKITEIRDKKEV